jgi:ribosomal-protein-alanine N-acetyltransferase
MEFQGTGFRLRPWQYSDEASLVENANNWKVWINLTDAFPHPYKVVHARRWLAMCQENPRRSTQRAIEVEGRAVGGIGFEPGSGIHRKTARIGYWLGEPYWGRGIATEALRLMSAYALERFELERLQAEVFEWNAASMRVLEKAGYALEGRLRRSCIKNGRMADELIYGLVAKR